MRHFRFGTASKRHLEGVDPDLVGVVRFALALSPVDFSVVDGVRSVEEQRLMVQQGVSWTMQSKHLLGEAVDLYPWVDGETSHEEEDYAGVQFAMDTAAQILGVKTRWGGEWAAPKTDKPHWELA